MSIFREAVEEILEPFLGGTKCKDCPRPKIAIGCTQCTTDRILAAYKGVVEGMEQLDPFVQSNIVPLTAQFEACKKYLLEGLE